MNITLIQYTYNPENTVAVAARLCYSDKDIRDISYMAELKDQSDFLRKVISLNHESVLEHASFSFGIEGISRACSHQLVRHRLASFSQRSQRYVRAGSAPAAVVPDSIMDSESRSIFAKAIMAAWEAYTALIENGVPAEDARYVLPNATTTSIVMTMNARELRHFFRLRCCNRAQWEIRQMADKMLKLCKRVAPVLFENAGASCVSGKCSEGKMSCGQPKTNGGK